MSEGGVERGKEYEREEWLRRERGWEMADGQTGGKRW